VAAFEEGKEDKPLGCVVLQSDEDGASFKMRQVAVHPSAQQQGIGAAMIHFCETFAQARGCTSIHCHARQSAASFYQKLGWKTESSTFLEVGIPHIAMRYNLCVKP
jgi:predicted GNAT family N-acyltransferase